MSLQPSQPTTRERLLLPYGATLLAIAFVTTTLAACTNPQLPNQETATIPATETNAQQPAQLGALGTVDFPTSCAENAQTHVRRGVAALHSFWYPVAINEFRESTRIDPGCMMGYWGEAMAHDHPIWGDPQETEAARQVLTKIRITSELTARERAYLNAVKVLYGEGDEVARDEAYSAAMEKIYREYPDDEDAALFYALSLMGTIQPGDPDSLQTRLRAGEIASSVFKKNPNHPGAAHYVIHAYDDPQNAIKALDAARRYAKIAPAAPHALHMPSHIFLQLGMWSEAAASNEASWTAADIQEKPKDRPVNPSDLEGYHSLHWLNYIYLQQGRYRDARELLLLMRQELAEATPDNPLQLYYAAYTYTNMAAAFVVETERWDLANELFEPLSALMRMNSPSGGKPQQPQSAAIQAALMSFANYRLTLSGTSVGCAAEFCSTSKYP